eukprot:gnl/TRDRNA2_/TRDRNA2_161341_c1_seq3.p1 gnl/TRDRNA2_/TRDRNA2_161341_c1~~gnl/TRDRNA2_/TRDRNA2_161341_c1_seq3.p1  ORF type:complete len:517 (-),score=72.57 gnl/TRDRNA2_/TRDRNA2_161341_c1_seq3:49-1599(-)
MPAVGAQPLLEAATASADEDRSASRSMAGVPVTLRPPPTSGIDEAAARSGRDSLGSNQTLAGPDTRQFFIGTPTPENHSDARDARSPSFWDQTPMPSTLQAGTPTGVAERRHRTRRRLFRDRRFDAAQIDGLTSREFEVDLLMGEKIVGKPIRVRLTRTMTFFHRAVQTVFTCGLYEVWLRFFSTGSRVFDADARLAVTNRGRLLLWTHSAAGGGLPLLQHYCRAAREPAFFALVSLLMLFIVFGSVLPWVDDDILQGFDIYRDGFFVIAVLFALAIVASTVVFHADSGRAAYDVLLRAGGDGREVRWEARGAAGGALWQVKSVRLHRLRSPLRKGEPVEVLSRWSGTSTWLPATVISASLASGYSVKVEDEPKALDRIAGSRVRRRYSAGEAVEVYHGPDVGWVDAFVRPDIVREGPRVLAEMRKLRCEMDGLLRPPSGDARSRRRGPFASEHELDLWSMVPIGFGEEDEQEAPLLQLVPSYLIRHPAPDPPPSLPPEDVPPDQKAPDEEDIAHL